MRDGGETEEDENRDDPPDDTGRNPEQNADPLLSGQIEQPAPAHYQVKYVLPKSRLSEEFSTLAENGVDMKRSITAEYDGRTTNDFTYLQIDVTRVPVGIHQLVLTIKDLQSQQSIQRKTLFRVIQ